MFSPWLVTVTTTSGITAPEGSATVPRIVPKVVCPSPGDARHTALKATLSARTKGLTLMVRLLILRSYSVTFLTVDKRFQKSVSFGPLLHAWRQACQVLFLWIRHRWSLLVAFCPPLVIASTGA